VNRRRYIATVGVAATTGLAGCSGGEQTSDDTGDETTTESSAPTAEGSDPTTTASGSGGASKTVTLNTDGSDYYFDPIGLLVQSGETVTFEIAGGSHSATSYHADNGYADVTRIPEGASGFDSETMNTQGATFEHTFETVGTYDYFCIPHKTLGMVGRIVVDRPGGPGADGQPPDGEVPASQAIVNAGSIGYDEFSG
jgi:plastocyanin